MANVHKEQVCDLTYHYGTHRPLVHDIVKRERFDLRVVEPADIVLSRSNQRVDYNAEARKQEDIITTVGNGMRKQLLQFKTHEEAHRKMEAGGGNRKVDGENRKVGGENRKVGGEKRKADAL